MRPYLAVTVLGLTGVIILIVLSKGNVHPKTDGFSTIEIVNTASGRIYDQRCIENEGEFAIEFIHSVNNSTVQEFFKVQGAEMQTTAVRFYSFGAGMQTELEEGQQLSRDGDAFVITGLDRIFTELHYIVGTVSDHLLLINGERISLRDMCGRNAHVTLRIK